MYEQLDCIDYGDGRPGGDFSTGIAGKVISKEQTQGERVNSVQWTVNRSRTALIDVH